jgi:hypothetical protein
MAQTISTSPKCILRIRNWIDNQTTQYVVAFILAHALEEQKKLSMQVFDPMVSRMPSHRLRLRLRLRSSSS